MMPAEFVPGTVTMLPDALAQLLHLQNQFLSSHRIEIFVHGASLFEFRLSDTVVSKEPAVHHIMVDC
jgi:hypothetical protein